MVASGVQGWNKEGQNRRELLFIMGILVFARFFFKDVHHY